MAKRIWALALACVLLTGCGSAAPEIEWIDDNYRNFYEIYVGAFYDSDGDGTGDLAGVTEKLDYILELGCNGIWMMPVMPSPTYHKYDVTDYEDIDPDYGTMADFDALVEAAHQKGIAVVIDFVINHTSSRHPWFQEACSYLKGLAEGAEPDAAVCPYVNYYHFSREQGSGYYAVPGANGWYYEGSFWSEMPDLDLTQEQVMEEILSAADFWVAHGTDGFRMDAAMHYEEAATEINTGILHTIYTHCLEQNPQFYMVSEVWAAQSAIADYYESKTPSMFNFPASGAEGIIEKAARGNADAEKLVRSMVSYESLYGAVNPDFINAYFLTNHDQVRVANNLNEDPDAMKYAGGLLAMMPGAVFVYYGEEIGMCSKGTADENKRLPFYWADDENGMCRKVSGADAVEQTFGSLAAQAQDENSLYRYYQRALRLRNENPAVARGTIEVIEALTDGDIAAVYRDYGEQDVIVLYNTGEAEAQLDLSGTDYSGMKLRGALSPDGSDARMKAGVVTLPAKSICVLG